MSAASPTPGSLVTSRLQQLEVALLARALATTLAAALPPALLEVEYVRSAADVLRRRPGQAIGVRIALADSVLRFRSPELGVTEASVQHVVRGVALSTEQVAVAQWLERLGTLLDEQAARDAGTSAALQRFLTDRT